MIVAKLCICEKILTMVAIDEGVSLYWCSQCGTIARLEGSMARWYTPCVSTPNLKPKVEQRDKEGVCT